jgi:nitroreductase
VKFDVAEIDRLLTTTRAVRRKLDPDRAVPVDVLLQLIDVAEQAPSGSNQASRRWLIITDPGVKAALGKIYREAEGGILDTFARSEAGSDATAKRVLDSAGRLVAELERVPALVALGIWGVHDGSGKPALFDSVIQAGWSFCLAARARGLGTAWTTLHLERRDEVAALLDIPPGFTQVVLFPIAWTTQDEFRPAPRRAAKEITYMDGWGFTDEQIPLDKRNNPVEGRGVCVSIDIDASSERVWELVSDINTPSRHCGEAQGATWDDGVGRAVGARFKGRNATEHTGHALIDAALMQLVGAMEWETTCTVTVWEPGRNFAYAVGDPDSPSATWGYRIEPLLDNTVRVEHWFCHGPGMSGTAYAAGQSPAQAEDVVEGRFRMIRDNLNKVLHGIRAEAKS